MAPKRASMLMAIKSSMSVPLKRPLCPLHAIVSRPLQSRLKATRTLSPLQHRISKMSLHRRKSLELADALLRRANLALGNHAFVLFEALVARVVHGYLPSEQKARRHAIPPGRFPNAAPGQCRSRKQCPLLLRREPPASAFDGSAHVQDLFFVRHRLPLSSGCPVETGATPSLRHITSPSSPAIEQDRRYSRDASISACNTL